MNHTWIKPIIGPQISPITGQHEENADETRDLRGARWWFAQGRREWPETKEQPCKTAKPTES
jgi:hypothetical protein